LRTIFANRESRFNPLWLVAAFLAGAVGGALGYVICAALHAWLV